MATKMKTYDWGGITLIVDQLKLATKPGQSGASATVSLTAAELTYLDDITAGTSKLSKAVIMDSSNNIDFGGTVDVGGAMTMDAAATVGTTLGVTGITTPIGGIANAKASLGAFTPRGIWVGGDGPASAAVYNDSTPVTTETYCSEIFVPLNCTITGIVVLNGSNVTGNMQVGLADAAGTVIAAANSAEVAGSGTDALQLIPFSSAYSAVGPATYWIQVQYSSGTARNNTHVLGSHGVVVQTSQTFGALANLTPATTFTTAVSNVCGLY